MRKVLLLISLAIICSCGLVFGAGFYLSKPANQKVTMPEVFETVVYNGTHGSLLKADSNEICALLIHGVRSNRSSMIDRSFFLRKNSITSFLIDLQAHGETPGKIITFGIRESRDAKNGVEFLKKVEKCDKVLAIGQSLGGASALLGSGPIDADALVLESVYPTIEEAIEDRLEIRLGAAGKKLAPLLYWQIPLRIDNSLSELHPIDVLPRVNIPVFIISGKLDKHTKVEETERMFNALTSKKSLWLVDGASHQDIFAFDSDAYESKILEFIRNYL